jgi:hypothetical protein
MPFTLPCVKYATSLAQASFADVVRPDQTASADFVRTVRIAASQTIIRRLSQCGIRAFGERSRSFVLESDTGIQFFKLANDA